MASLKETLKKYIAENNIKLKEQEGPQDEVVAAREALFNVSDERLLQAIRSLESVDQIGAFMIDLIDFANKMSPAPDLTKQLAHQFIDKGMIDMDDEEEDGVSSVEVDVDVDSEEDQSLMEDEDRKKYLMLLDMFKNLKKSNVSSQSEEYQDLLKRVKDAMEKIGIDSKHIKEIAKEISTSGNAGAYLTKAAFKPKYGYKLVKKKSKKDS